MTKVYEVFRKGNDPGRDIPEYEDAVNVLIDRIPQGNSYEWKRRGQTVYRSSPSKPALKDTLLGKKLDVGEAFYARREGGRAIYVLRAIDIVPKGQPCPDPLATQGVKELWDAAQVATFQAEEHFNRPLDFVFMGIFNCRRIDGSSSWSQHAFHNALDFRLRRADAPDSSIDVEATTFVVNKIKALAAESLWRVSGHFFHAHETGVPKKFGTPECA